MVEIKFKSQNEDMPIKTFPLHSVTRLYANEAHGAPSFICIINYTIYT